MIGRLLCGLAALTSCGQLFGLDRVDELDEPLDGSTALGDSANVAMLVEGFEGALDPRWTRSLENGDECTTTTEQAASGSQSLRCSTDGTSGSRAALVFGFDPTTTLRVQLSVRFEAHPQSFLAFVQTVHAGASQTRRLVNADYYPSSRIDVWNYQTQSFDYHPATVNLHTWYHVDLTARISSTAGSVALALDGASGASLDNIDTTDLPINELQIGITLVNTSIDSLTMYIDDVVVSEM